MLFILFSLGIVTSQRFPYFCPPGSYFTEQRCQPCFTNQCECSKPFGCDRVVCRSDQVSIQENLYNSFINEYRLLQKCYDCPIGCATCEGEIPGAFTCQKCMPDYYLLRSVCVPVQNPNLPEYLYDEIIIQRILETAAPCQAYNDYYQCVSCLPASFLNEMGICEKCGGYCVSCDIRQICNECSQGYFWNPGSSNNGQCSLCRTNPDQNTIQCLSCDQQGYSCIECAPGYYLTKQSQYIQDCSYCKGNSEKNYSSSFGCKACQSNGLCQLCYPGYYMSDEICILCFGNQNSTSKDELSCKDCSIGRAQSCDICNVGFQLLVGTCVNCASAQPNCLECTYSNDGKKNVICKVCDNGYYLVKQDYSEGSCMPCPPDMVRCYQNDYGNLQLIQPLPTQCQDQYFLVHQFYNTERVVCKLALVDSQCYIMKDDSQECLECYPFDKWIQQGYRCIQCQGEDGIGMMGCKKCALDKNQKAICLNCVTGYVLVNSQCQQCLDGCLQCNTNLKCTQCSDGYNLNSQFCEKCRVTNCKTCAQSAASCDVCMDGYFHVDGQNPTCNVCPPGCSNCQESLGAVCVSCLPGYYKYLDGCRTAVPFCAKLDSNGLCTLCQYGYRLQNQRCLPCLDQMGAYVCGVNAGFDCSSYLISLALVFLLALL